MIKFFRGPRTSYNSGIHANGIYFATDTFEILVDGNSYGIDPNQVRDIDFNNTTLEFIFSYNGATDKVVKLADALGDKILTPDDRTLLDNVKEMMENMSASIIYTSKLDGDISTVKELGGIAAGTKVNQLSGKEVSEVLDALIFPTVQPDKVDNTVSISRNSGVTDIRKVGGTPWTKDDFTVTPNVGQIRINGVKKQDYAGAASNIVVNGVPVEMTYGKKSITGSATFAEGPQPLDSKGGNATSITKYAGGTKNSSAIYVYVVYPFFANTNITEFIELPLVKSDVNNFIVNYAAEEGTNKHTIKVPTVRDIIKIELLNTLSGKYEEVAKTNFIKTTETINGVGYNIYTRNQGTNGEATFKFTYKNN